jgi:hypothetical protein
LTNSNIVVAVIGLVAGLSACGDFDVRCDPVAPTVLPDGSKPGLPKTDRSLGPEMLIWGSEGSAVRELVTRVGGGDGIEATPGLLIGVYPAQFRDADVSPFHRPGIRWQQAVCRYEIWLDPSLTDAETIDYAARF